MVRQYRMNPTISERNRRWREIRRAMQRSNVDCLLIWGNGSHWGRGSASLRYVSGIGANEEEGLCIFPLDGEPTVIIWHPAMTLWWKRAQNWVKDVRGRSEHGWAHVVNDRFHEMNMTRGNIGLVDFRDTQTCNRFDEEEAVRALFPELKFSDQTRMLMEIRMIKSEEEIDLLTQASQIVDSMFNAIMENARPGVLETKVYSSIVKTMLDSGGEYPEMILWDAARYPNVHPGRTPLPRKLKKDDVVSIELHSKYGGYLGHGERCVFLSKPNNHFERIHEVTIDTAEVALDHLRSGESLEDLASAMAEPVKKANLGVTEMGVHGHGVSSGEYPTFLQFPFHYPGADKPFPFSLKENMVFGLTVDLYDPKFRNGTTGLMYADTVLVTSKKGRRLTKLPLGIMQV